MRKHRFDEAPMIHAVKRLRRFTLLGVEVHDQPLPFIDRRAQDSLSLPLVRCVREVAMLIVRPCNDVLVVDSLLKHGKEMLRSFSLEVYSHLLSSFLLA